MAIIVEDLGELGYGGLVTAATWWDEKRIARGDVLPNEILKKLGTWAYLIPGGVATAMSAFGIWRRQESWLERVQAGFIYDFPRFLRNVVTSMQSNGGTAASAAVREAQRLVQTRQTARQLGSGGRSAQRSYEPEFSSIGVI